MRNRFYATATIYGGVVECEEGRRGCGTAVRGGPGLAGGGGGRPLCQSEVLGEPSRSCVAASAARLQEAATVSAVSLTANEFPGGGGRRRAGV